MGWFDDDAQDARADTAGRRYTVAGRPLRCVHCAAERFTGRDVPLGSRTAALLDTDWLSAGAYAMSCAECSAIQWFATKPERLGS